MILALKRTVPSGTFEAVCTRLALASLLLAGISGSLAAEQVGKAVDFGPDGQLTYEHDSLGNRMPDFSSAGYDGGGKPLPVADVKIVVKPVEGDDGQRIQAAIDYVSGLPMGKNGLRGAVQLLSGVYEVGESLAIRSSGVVLRGVGSNPDGTRILATGTDRRPLIQVKGKGEQVAGLPEAVSARYTPVGSDRLEVSKGNKFSAGDRVQVTRPSPLPWIQEVGMDKAPARTHYAWKAGKLDLVCERTVISIDGNTLTLDAPLTCALEEDFGAARIQKIETTGRLENIGIESIRCISEFDTRNIKDENHSWMAVHVDHVENAWIADVTGQHFTSSIVYLGAGCRRITVQDCRSLDPVSETGGYRRQAFHSDGQQTLFLRCYSENGFDDFTVGYLAAGPNVFLECEASHSTGMSGSIGSWATGILFDNVTIDGGSLALDNLEIRYGGVGWAAANSVLWQSSASEVVCRSPRGAMNWAIGVWGQFLGDGRWQASNEFVEPQSLYRAQLAERLGIKAQDALDPMCVASQTFPEELFLEELDLCGVSGIAELNTSPMRLENGWLVNADGLMRGYSRPTSWWRGHLLPARTTEHNTAITRFLPGRTGGGATEDLEALAEEMDTLGQGILRHHWGLWYDRRREDHQMIRRMTDDVWPPFYEQPWARSGQGTAWDGLSRYDLTEFNPWYFKRLKDFAELAGRRGLVLINEMYFQHNILESGAHWVDFPWRPVNALQDTGFTEPPPFTGDTIKMADEFYDLSHPLRRELHRSYIRQCLANLAGETNVIHTVGAEYSGPLHFVEFWIDVINEWIQETGNDPLVALSVPKDVQDSILSDPERSPVIDIIELKYWWYTGNKTYAPKGGENLAPRQHLRKWSGGKPSAANVTRMVREYREQFPDKAVIFPSNDPAQCRAALKGGASLSSSSIVDFSELQLIDAKE